MRPHATAVLAALLLTLACAAPSAAQVAPPSAPVRVLPPSELPRTGFPRLRRSFDGSDEAHRADVREWISHLEELSGQLDGALAANDDEAVADLLSEAMSELAFLVREPDARSDARFAAVHSDILASYETFYGEALPESSFYDEVFAVRDELAGLLVELENPLGASEVAVEPITATVPMTVNRTVTSTMDWLRSKPNTLKNWLTRAHTYFPMIEKIFAEEGVPDELKYLAMIESGLRPSVKSRAKAVGMWQFIAATGGAYGLKVDRWVDDRMDPEKATRAAARHLKDLYAQYNNDWHVALAGYNCSPRCIKRAIASAQRKGHENPSYWDMYEFLPRETRGYVPQFIATALMLSNPSAYGLSTDEVAPVYEYEVVPVHGAISLDKVAQYAGVDKATLEFLNPSLHRGFVPRTRDGYPLRLPIGSSAAFVETYASLPPESFVPPDEYVVRKGDTLGRIAQKYDTSVAELKRENGLKSDRLRIGQVLQVPFDETQVVEAAPAPTRDPAARVEPVKVQYGTLALRPVAPSEPFVGDLVVDNSPSPRIPVTTASLRATPGVEPSTDVPAQTGSGDVVTETVAPETFPADAAPAASPTPESRPSAGTVVDYTIRRGDTLNDIARKYGVSVEDLRRWNGMRGSSIKAGARLKLYLDGAQEPAAAAAPAVAPAPERVTYRVKRGDTLYDLARANGVTVDQLRQWNNLRGSSIRPGQRLTIYPGSTGDGGSRTHTVVRGDTLIEIARRYGVKVDQIKAWNGLSSSRINPGDELRIAR